MILQSIILITFILIIISLGSALFHLIKHKPEEQSQKTLRSLTFRISLSLVLFAFIFIAFATGLIKPHGIGVKMNRPHVAEVEQNKH